MKIRRGERGFALPTIVLASVILMMVLAGSLSIASSNSVALHQQQLDQLMREAAEAGLQYANACYMQVVGTATAGQWPNTGTLDTGEDCYGAPKAGTNCTTLSAAATCFVVSNGSIRTHFSVTASVGVSGTAYVTLSAIGYADKIRTSDMSVAETTQTNVRSNFSTDLYGMVSGNDTSCSIVDGKLYCWGWNDYGQVGNGTITPGVYVTSPQLVKGALSGLYVQAVATGITYTCALAGTTPIASASAGNAVYCWGDNTSYYYGNNSTTASYTPVQVLTMANYYFTDITASFHTCVVAKSTVSPYNSNLFCWGVNDQYQAGEDSATNAAAVTTNPKKVPNVAVRTGNATTTNLNSVSFVDGVSSDMTCGINGLVPFCFGNNANGQGGWGTNSGDYARPTLLSSYLTNTTEIRTNRGRVCALNGGKLYCWGNNANWRIDSGPAFSSLSEQTTPKRIHTTANATLYNATITDFAITDWNTCILVSGQVYCSGYNNYGQLGIGTFTGVTDGTATSASQVTSADSAVAVAGGLQGKTVARLTAGNNHFCAVTNDRLVYCWGLNAYGQLGDGTTTNRAVPTRVVLPQVVVY